MSLLTPDGLAGGRRVGYGGRVDLPPIGSWVVILRAWSGEAAGQAGQVVGHSQKYDPEYPIAVSAQIGDGFIWDEQVRTMPQALEAAMPHGGEYSWVSRWRPATPDEIARACMSGSAELEG